MLNQKVSNTASS